MTLHVLVKPSVLTTLSIRESAVPVLQQGICTKLMNIRTTLYGGQHEELAEISSTMLGTSYLQWYNTMQISSFSILHHL